jgi:hypothetical protein
MLDRGVVGHEVEDQLDVPGMQLRDQAVEVTHPSE